MVSSDFQQQMDGYGLTTARLLYHMPDHPSVLQEFIWQTHDLAPEFPELTRFVDFWVEKIEGPLHSVFYAHRRLIGPNEWQTVDGEFRLH